MRHQKSKRLARKGNASDRTQTCQLITSNFSPSPFGSRSYRHEDSPAHPSPHLKIPYLDQIQTEGGRELLHREKPLSGWNHYRDGWNVGAAGNPDHLRSKKASYTTEPQ